MDKSNVLVLAGVVVGCAAPSATLEGAAEMEVSADATYEVVARADVPWQKLNPARGDQSPKAGTLWGDRKADVATGFLAEFTDGFSSPPHIHNVSYRAVVIEGMVHNDDPEAAEMWMPAGSYWTQPKGEAHITSAKGTKNVAYVEIEAGPYLVKPIEEAFDSGERPVNVDASNLVWEDLTTTPYYVGEGAGAGAAPEVAYLWEGEERRGFMFKLPAGFEGRLYAPAPDLRAVVIAGEVGHVNPTDGSEAALPPGSYFGSTGAASHQVACTSSVGCVVYVRATSGVRVVR